MIGAFRDCCRVRYLSASVTVFGLFGTGPCLSTFIFNGRLSLKQGSVAVGLTLGLGGSLMSRDDDFHANVDVM